MAKTSRTAQPDDRDALKRQIEALQREVTELKAELRAERAREPTDRTWFTPALLSLLFVGLLAALWAKYAPPVRPRGAAVVDAAGNPGAQTPPRP